MFCQNCGKDMESGTMFCTECGAKNVETQPAAPIAPPPSTTQAPPPPYQPPTRFAQQSNYQPQYKKKKPVGLLIFISILLLIICGLVFVLGSIMWFPPKDLGVKYTQTDFNSAIRKTGIHITADLGNGETFDNKPILTGGATAKAKSTISDSTRSNGLSYKKFNFKFSKYKHKVFQLTPSEATAFFNDIAPEFFWFTKIQLKINADGTLVTSSNANIKKMKQELFGDVAGKIPFPLPDKINLYTESKFSITKNKISMVPKVFESGVLSLPNEYRSGSNLKAFCGYLDRFYKVVPGLKVNKAGVKNGQFYFDGILPTEISVTPRR